MATSSKTTGGTARLVRGRRTVALAALAVLVAALPACAMPGGPGGSNPRVPRVEPAPPATPLDCTDWRYGPADQPAPGVIPAEQDLDDYKRTSRRDTRPELFNSPQNLCGQKGSAVDLAWGVTKGRDDVLIAVLDSGIRWRRPDAIDDLATKAFVNIGEAHPPCAAPTGDCNGDGVFDIGDFGPIADRNGNGLADPEDLILDPAFSDGRDDDRNGYVDDISGWDFVYGDNNPLDTPDYGHGTGEAEDSSAAENGSGEVGTCPKCRFLPVRVGTSFIADGGRFAAGLIFGLDSGADVIQEALGAVTNPRQAQQAIDAAYRRGVVVVASMADEASKHPNLSSSLEHTMTVNSITTRRPLLGGDVEGYLALNGCTNYGGRTFVSVESGSCSSEATGMSSGMVGLLESEARDAGLARHPGLARYRHEGVQNVLSANEAMQVVRTTADDIDFSTPNAVDPANNFGTPTGGLIDTVRYPTTPHWDATFGYGRVNTYEMVKAVRDGRIPPEADLTGPLWFDVLPARGVVDVTGRAAAVRARSYDYRVEWAAGLQPPLHPDVDEWHVVAERRGLRHPVEGRLGRIDLASVAAALPDHATGTPSDPATGRPAEERFSARFRIVVTAHGGPGDGLTGISQKQVFVHDDPQLARGYPARIEGVGTSSPAFADLDGRPGDELILATDDGLIHAFDRRGRDIRGWPARLAPMPTWPADSPTARRDHIAAPGGQVGVGAPVVADLDADGRLDVVVTDFEGNVWAFASNGRPKPGFGAVRVDGRLRSPVRVDPRFSADDPAVQNPENRLQPAFLSQAAAADLDGDGRLEIVATSLDRHVYAWHADGTPVDGFPVLVVDPATVESVDPVSHSVTFKAGANAKEGGGMVAPPSVADLDGDGRPEIVVGAQEEYEEPINVGDGASTLALMGAAGSEMGNTRAYAISPDGAATVRPDPYPASANPHAVAYLPGWPARIGMLSLEVLPTLGAGVAVRPAIGDVNAAHPGPEVVVAGAVGPVYVLGSDGRSVFGQVGGRDLPLTWSGGLGGEGNARFGPQRSSNDIVAAIANFAGPSIGRLDADDRPDVTSPTSGLTRLLDVEGDDHQLPADDQLGAWSGLTGDALAGFPQKVSDMAFFVSPVVADLDGDGRNETIAGNGVYMLEARHADGTAPAGWPKLTGGWLVGSPALGDLDADGRAELAVVRRDGVLIVWHTAQPAAPGQPAGDWPRSGGNGANTGSYEG